MNILYGLYHPDEGEIRLHGKPVRIDSPQRGDRARHRDGAPALHAHPGDDGGREHRARASSRGRGRSSTSTPPRSACASSRSASASPSGPTRGSSRSRVGQQQRVEILKALYRGADILILDEPTAVLTPQEADELFAIIRSLQAEGKSIIFITHKLNEVLAIADRITVLRRGKTIETVPREGATEEGLRELMVGREVLLRVDKTPGDARGPAPRGRGPARARRARARGRARGLARRSRRRDRRHRGRRRQRPERADRRDHRPPQDRGAAGSRPAARTSPTRARATASTAGSATSPRTGTGAASCSTSRSPRTSRSTTTPRSRTRASAGSSRSASSRARASC